MNIEVIRYRLPVYWVGALINDDWTGLSDEEAQEVDDFVKHADRIMKAAQLIANSSAALIQAMGMMSENIERANRGESMAYTEDSFMKLIQDNKITYNNVIQRGWRL